MKNILKLQITNNTQQNLSYRELFQFLLKLSKESWTPQSIIEEFVLGAQ
jgi:hypothetical protein